MQRFFPRILILNTVILNTVLVCATTSNAEQKDKEANREADTSTSLEPTNPRVQAYLLLQKPYRDCVKVQLKAMYEIEVSQCMAEAGPLADREQCRALAEKIVNQNAQQAENTKSCLALKPSKKQFDDKIKQLSSQH